MILAFDCTLHRVSAALLADGRIVDQRWEDHRSAAEILVPMIHDLVTTRGIDYRQITRLAVTVGPGSFTGIRIGLAAARALQLAHGMTSAGVDSLSAMAQMAQDIVEHDRTLSPKKDGYVVAIDTKRGDFYAQAFALNGTALGAPVIVAPDDIADWIRRENFYLMSDQPNLFASDPRAAASVLHPAPDDTLAVSLARRVQNTDEFLPLRPLYLRPPETSVAKFQGFTVP